VPDRKPNIYHHKALFNKWVLFVFMSDVTPKKQTGYYLIKPARFDETQAQLSCACES